jgi:type II restriction/modification system DNA methylase subunit YeeA
VFYTPKYITKYIVENTIGKLCEEKKTEVNLVEEDYNTNRQTKTKKDLLKKLNTYREWLLQLTVVDPACGSGAFLNEALNYLIAEHQYLDELETKLMGGGLVFPNVEKGILENNLFGVDINNESVEIAKLSL